MLAGVQQKNCCAVRSSSAPFATPLKLAVFHLRLFVLWGALLLGGAGAVRAADALVDGAVTAIAALTDPNRLESLPDESQFRAQLGPALGWLHVARRRDVSPEAVILRAFTANGLHGERARLTREALLRNLARADAWELFGNAVSARALADGRPAPIGVGTHRGHLALTAVVLPEGLGAADKREFACLVLRADDELPPRPVRRYQRQPGDRLARQLDRDRKPRPAARKAAVPVQPVPAAPMVYDEPLPAS